MASAGLQKPRTFLGRKAQACAFHWSFFPWERMQKTY